jgi:hypothetical protein
MATGNYSASSMVQTHPHAPHPSQAQAQSPPSRRDLASWWYKFKKTTKKEEEKGNIAPKLPRFIGISRFTLLPFFGRFREIDADSLALQEILEFAKGHGGYTPPDLCSLISKQDSLTFDGESCDGELPRCYFLKYRGRSVTSLAEPRQMREHSQTSRTASPALACLNVFHRPHSDPPSRLTTYKHHQATEVPTGIFGVPLQVSIKYANVAISLTNSEGKSFVYGYVPIVVAKCGVFLKEKGATPPPSTTV